MSERKWTAEQEAAINARGANVLVSAGAGSGKTAVLVERVIRRLFEGQSPPEIDEILVVTFTKAAAEEMRARISQALTERAQKHPADRRVLRQLGLLQQAPITTLHSFCLEIVKQNFYRAGLPASFRIAKEVELGLLQEEVMEEFIENEYESGNKTLIELADAYGGARDDGGLLRVIFELYLFSRSQPDPENWLEKAAGTPPESLDSMPYVPYLRRMIKKELSHCLYYLEAAAALCAAPGGPQEWSDYLREEISACKGLIGALSLPLAELFARLGDLKFAVLSKKSAAAEEVRDEVKKTREKAKEKYAGLLKNFGGREPGALLDDLRRQNPLLEGLSRLVLGYSWALAEEKRKRGLVDFADMEHFCLEILEDGESGVAAELKSRFKEILVDEYQDINAVQEKILSLVASGGNSFFVGDVKQGIYRFRLADPTLFLGKFDDYGAGQGGRLIPLNRNFRSVKSVIDGVNFIFSRLMSKATAEINYDESAELVAGREAEGKPVELYLIDKHDAEEEEDSGAARREARLLGRKILELQKEDYPQEKSQEKRKYQLRDMAVLLRSKNWAGVYGEELALMGIPSAADSHGGYLETPEVTLVMSLLQVIDNPLQEIELAAVLRSPLGGFSLDELAELRLSHKGCLYEALAASPLPQAALFLRRLGAWAEEARSGRISRLIWQIYGETGFFHLAGAMPQGEQRQANLTALCDRARDYEQSSFKGLFRFIRFITDARERGHDFGSPRLLGEQENLVRIMSIHHSKGLEFPVVFIGGLGRRFNLRDSSRDVLFHRELGLAARLADRQKRRKYPTLAWQALAQKLTEEAVAEEMRVLYVAMTRARERLVMIGSAAGLGRAVSRWSLGVSGGDILPAALMAQDRCYLDWLGRALLPHADAEKLRLLAGGGAGGVLGEPGLFGIYPAGAEAEEERLVPPAPKEDIQERGEEIERILNWRYPHQAATALAAKWTVSGLQSLHNAYRHEAGAAITTPDEFIKTQNEAEEFPRGIGVPGDHDESYMPFWAEEEERDSGSAEEGNAYHKVMELLEFAHTAPEQIEGQIAVLTREGRLTGDEAALLDARRLAGLFSSPLGERLRKAEKIVREQPFVYAMSAADFGAVLPGLGAEDRALLQGRVDLAFFEGDGWVIVDYKTGAYGADEAELRRRYGVQFACYRRALADIWRQPVKECYLYLFSAGRAVPMD
ncbi:MAG: helicase-exonuclease AddAB subunit AddA [Clostridiales bacterium]|nr:helicase-exonuclease AddAB subunit AddA [Clostridiales bacterium]